jgi:hypothetical protein
MFRNSWVSVEPEAIWWVKDDGKVLNIRPGTIWFKAESRGRLCLGGDAQSSYIAITDFLNF